jgi:hypothetical protein
MQISRKSLNENIVANYSYLATVRTCFRLIVLQGPMCLSMSRCWKKKPFMILISFSQKNFPIRSFLKDGDQTWVKVFPRLLDVE